MSKTNIKLKGVEVDAFRGFANPVKFDFVTNKGQLADLVVIFAPNGFGKTSFFEGVEWSVKGRIERIDENPTIRHMAEKVKGNILKNHHATATRGRVRLIDSDGTFFERSTSSSKNWDLLPGLINQKSTSPIFQGLKTVNKNKQIEILPQSRIDSFLSSKTPQQKYEALLDFWGGKDDSAYYVGVSKLLEYTKSDMAELIETISGLEADIREISKSESRISVFNSLINQLNRSELFDKKLLLFDENTSQSTLKNTTSEILRMTAELELRVRDAATNQTRLVGLETTVNEYSENLKRKNELEHMLAQLRKSEVDLKVLKSRITEKENLETQIQQLNISLSELAMIAAAHKDFFEITRSIRMLDQEKQDLTHLLQNLATTRTQLTADMGELNKRLKQLTSDQETAAKNNDVIKDLQRRITDSNSKLPHVSNRLLTATRIKAIFDQRVLQLSQQINTLENIIRQPLAVFVNSMALDEFLSTGAQEIKTIYELITDLKNQITVAEERLLKLGSLDENLDKLIEFGSLYVRDTETNTCPLCETSQTDFNTLINLIERQKSDVLGTDQLNSELSTLKASLKSREEQVEKLFAALKATLQSQAQNLASEVRDADRKCTLFAGYMKYYETIISLAGLEHERALSEISNLSSRNEKLLQTVKDVDAIKAQLNKDIQQFLQSLNANKVDTDNASTKLAETEARLRTESNQGLYLKVNTYLKNYKISEDYFLKSGLADRKSVLERSLKTLEINLKEINVFIAQLEKLDLPVDITIVMQEILTVDQQLKDTLSKISAFIDRYYEALNNRDVSKRTIRDAIAALTRAEKSMNGALLQLRQLQENVEYMQSSIYLNAKRTELADLQKQLNVLVTSETKLTALKDKVSTYLSDKINSVFNQQTINDIYQKIDPHPDLKQIRLEPKFDEVKPTLNIFAVNEEGAKPVDPALYLSSAQVNILSLSIFLAKALQNNDVLINTIFMDDPIQYLDSINVLSFIDLMRIIITDKKINRQLVISTHDENFFKLLQRKFDPEYYPAKFIQFESYGKLAASS